MASFPTIVLRGEIEIEVVFGLGKGHADMKLISEIAN